MLIRRPVADVFEAFINPEVTTNFWFTKSSGRLEEGKHVQWDWEMYGASSKSNVKEIEYNKRILMDWIGGGSTTQLEWIFTEYGKDWTFVEITHSGFNGDADAKVNAALDSTSGFMLVLAGLKAWLEHGVKLNLVADRHPR